MEARATLGMLRHPNLAPSGVGHATETANLSARFRTCNLETEISAAKLARGDGTIAALAVFVVGICDPIPRTE